MIRSSPSIDLPLVALIIKVSSATCNVHHHCSSFQILPKSSQKFVKVHPKSTKIAPKSCPKSILDPKRVPKPSPTRFFRFFIDFLSLRGLRKSSQNRKKSKKSDEKSMSKTHGFQHLFFSIFLGFGLRKRLQNRGFFDAFSKTAIL